MAGFDQTGGSQWDCSSGISTRDASQDTARGSDRAALGTGDYNGNCFLTDPRGILTLLTGTASTQMTKQVLHGRPDLCHCCDQHCPHTQQPQTLCYFSLIPTLDQINLCI